MSRNYAQWQKEVEDKELDRRNKINAKLKAPVKASDFPMPKLNPDGSLADKSKEKNSGK